MFQNYDKIHVDSLSPPHLPPCLELNDETQIQFFKSTQTKSAIFEDSDIYAHCTCNDESKQIFSSSLNAQCYTTLKVGTFRNQILL